MCPNYWHFSPYGFCPYDCNYYLAGTRGVWFSPAVKVFLNLPEIIREIDREANRIARPTAFYVGKLQDGLALDPLTDYSRELVPFFASFFLSNACLHSGMNDHFPRCVFRSPVVFALGSTRRSNR